MPSLPSVWTSAGAKRKAISELGVTIDVAGSLNKERKVLVKSAPEPKSASSGIGAVFGVDATGAVFFNTAVPGSSCGDAVSRQQLRTGDTLFAVDGAPVYRAPLNVVASKLLGASGSRAVVTFKRGEETIVLELERRPTDMLAAQKAVTKAKASSGVERIRYASED